jgi:hypothetical protein
MLRLKILLLSWLGALLIGVTLNATQRKPAPGRLAAYRDNQCVMCHASLTEPLRVSAHFYEWLNSPHERKKVGCEKCHGGDPSITTFRTAHQGVERASFPASRLAPKNAPETCRSCHQLAAQVFTQSRHFQQLLTTGDGPSCTTCHHHMAASVIYRPPDTAALCASCHSARGPAAASIKVPEQAGDTIAAFNRADEVLDWSRLLITQGKKRRLSFSSEEAAIARFEQTLKEAKLDWHAFELNVSRAKADQVFTQATKLKDQLTDRIHK